VSGTITLIGKTWANTRPLKVTTRPVTEEDADGLAKLFFASYDDQSVVGSQAEALEIIHKVFNGDFGALIESASPVVVDGSGRLVAAALVLDSRVGNDVPDAPYIFELFTAASRRREGFAEQLLRIAIDELYRLGHEEVALRIAEDNSPALALYLTLDFKRWIPEDDSEL
jgi:GNAT superfamily N-acetyltransferase